MPDNPQTNWRGPKGLSTTPTIIQAIPNDGSWLAAFTGDDGKEHTLDFVVLVILTVNGRPHLDGFDYDGFLISQYANFVGFRRAESGE